MSVSKYENLRGDPAGYFVFVRFWPDWFSDSNFPFDQFNAAPDDRFAIEVEEFVKNNDECKAKLADALKARWSQFTRRPMRRVRSSLDTTRREIEIESWALGDIQSHAKSLGLSPDKSKPELVELILEAEEFRLQRDRDALCSLHQKPARHFRGRLEDFIQGNLAEASLFDYARAAGWVRRFATIVKGELPASPRQIVWRANERQEAELLTAALQDRFGGLQPCTRFGVLPVGDFTSAQRITIQRNIEILCGTEAIPSHVASKLDSPDILRSIVQEAAKIADKLHATPRESISVREAAHGAENIGDPQSVQRFVPGEFQRRILDALEHQALRTDELAAKLDIDRRRIFRKPGGMAELKEHHLVKTHPRLGYYRPDKPPRELQPETGSTQDSTN